MAVVFTVNASDLSKLGQPGTTWWDVVVLLRPVWAVAILAYGFFPLGAYLLRASGEKRGKQSTYPYEFAFRLDENVDPKKLQNHVGASKRRKLSTNNLGKTLWAMNRGYGRIEHISMDSTIVKVHTVIAFRLRPLG